MGFEISCIADVLGHGFDEVIDVRSPGEFAEDHLPGAINLPVLDDAERAEIGTIYKQESPFLARKLGAALIARRAAGHLEGHFRDKCGGYRPLIYCWRGGQRSQALAVILTQIGWRAETVAGGYRSYRRAVVRMLYARPGEQEGGLERLIVLDGNTGTAKTALLNRLGGRGVQVIDLEALAAHRGSVFGASASGQPSQKAFDSAIATRLGGFDPGQPILVEAESSKIGALRLPHVLWAAMRTAPRLRLAAAPADRAAYLARTYADLAADGERLARTLEKLRPYQPKDRVDAWLELAARGRIEALARDLIDHHYDPAYARQRARDTQVEAGTVRLDGFSDADLVTATDRLLALIGAVSLTDQPALIAGVPGTR